MNDQELRALAECNQEKAWELIRSARIPELWREAGYEINLVGSLTTGLLMTHLDIDFHFYSASPDFARDIELFRKLSQRLDLRGLTFTDGLRTVEECQEYHVTCRDKDDREWQLDFIHIRQGSRYDGWFERVAQRISELLTPETRDVILRLKYDTRPDVKICGVEYYAAVLRDGVHTYSDLLEWRSQNPVETLIDWMP